MLLVDLTDSFFPVHFAQLPDNSKGQGDTSINNVDASNSNKDCSQFVADFDNVVAILDDEYSVFLCWNLLPVDYSWLEVIEDFEQDDTVSEIVHEIVDVDLLNSLRVDPVLEDSDLSGLVCFWLRREVWDLFLLLDDETVLVVEYLCAEESI